MKRLQMNRNQIKYLVIIAMVIDHIAWAWVPTTSPAGQLMHFFGRLTGPTMAFFVAEGYLHTHNRGKYAGRLALFALLSWPAFCLFEFGVFPVRMMHGYVHGTGLWSFPMHYYTRTLVIYPYFGVIYSLLLGLLAIWLWDTERIPLPLRLLGAALLVWLSRYGDWQYFDVLWALNFFLLRDRPVLKWLGYCLIGGATFVLFAPWDNGLDSCLFQFGVFLVPLLLNCFYNGQSGSRKTIHKWFFYLFYPLHLLLLAFLRF